MSDPVKQGRELHVLQSGSAQKAEGEGRPLTDQMKVAVLFAQGKTVQNVADELGLYRADVERMVRDQMAAIARQADTMLGELKRLIDEYRAVHRQASEVGVDGYGENEKERLYREAKADVAFDVMQALQLVQDTGWHRRATGGRDKVK